MFTIEQIKEAHATVKSGADFPNYIKLLKGLGIRSYIHFVADGHILYLGVDDQQLHAPAKWEPVDIADKAATEDLQHALSIHQQGQTDYLTFCKQAAAAGVDKWIVDIEAMLCTYYSKHEEEMFAEQIPG